MLVDTRCSPVVCAGCGARTTVWSVWSTVDRCPRCLEPLMVPSRALPMGSAARRHAAVRPGEAGAGAFPDTTPTIER
ncbi:MAG: hypothetical protein QOF29_1640 [bacterium]